MNEQRYMEYDEQAARERRARRIQEMKRQKARRLLIQKCVVIAIPVFVVLLVGTIFLTGGKKASANSEGNENVLADAGNAGVTADTETTEGEMEGSEETLQDNAGETEEEKELFFKYLIKSMDVAKMLGADYSVVHPFAPLIPIDEYDEKKQHEIAVKDLAPVAEYAHKIGLPIVVENMRYAYEKERVRR